MKKALLVLLFTATAFALTLSAFRITQDAERVNQLLQKLSEERNALDGAVSREREAGRNKAEEDYYRGIYSACMGLYSPSPAICMRIVQGAQGEHFWEEPDEGFYFVPQRGNTN